MKFQHLLLYSSIVILTENLLTAAMPEPTPAPAPVAAEAAADLAAMARELRELRQGMQELQTRHQKEIEALRQQVTGQQQEIEALRKTGADAATPAVLPPAAPVDAVPGIPTEDPLLVPATSAAASSPLSPQASAFPTTDPSLTGGQAFPATDPGLGMAPVPAAGAPRGSYLNLSFDAIVTAAASTAPDLDLLEVGDHDPQQRGFNARGFELALDGAVDPWFQGFANIVYKLDDQDETDLELEEAYGQTTALPGGLQVKAGQFFSPFGRGNQTHPHTWDFVDTPLVQGRLLGPDGLRGIGAQVSWTMPLPFYAQAMFAVQNGQGGTAYPFRNPGEDGTFFDRTTMGQEIHGINDLLVVPRIEASFDLTPTQTILFGASAAFGQNDTGYDCDTRIYGLDFFYKWKPVDAEGGWPFVKWQTEAMCRDFEAGRGLNNSFPAAEGFDDWGIYSQVVWGFRKGWSLGLRGDYLHMEDSLLTSDPLRQSRSRLAADLTWYPSEFSKLRLQYNHDWLQSNTFQPDRDEDSIFLMYEISLGAHGSHKY